MATRRIVLFELVSSLTQGTVGKVSVVHHQHVKHHETLLDACIITLHNVSHDYHMTMDVL